MPQNDADVALPGSDSGTKIEFRLQNTIGFGNFSGNHDERINDDDVSVIPRSAHFRPAEQAAAALVRIARRDLGTDQGARPPCKAVTRTRTPMPPPHR